MKVLAGGASEKIHERLDSLKRKAGPPKTARDRQLVEALEALQEALQEVEVVETELQQQNEELVMTLEALELQRHRYQEMFELAPDSYLLTDGQGVIQEANRAASRLLNASQVALRGKPLVVFLPPERRSELRLLVSDLKPGQWFHGSEIELRPRDAPPRTTLVSVSRDEDKPTSPARLRWILRDVTDRKVAEEALRDSEARLRHSQKLESIGRLAGGVAHSFNNLLAAIAFHAELVHQDVPADSRARHHAEEILQAGERAADLARQLLAFGRKQVLQARTLCLNEVVSSLQPVLRRLLGEQVRLRTDLSERPVYVYADLGQLEQVLFNLVVNARDATPSGGEVTVSTSARTLESEQSWNGERLAPGRYAVLSVSDTGTGMPAEVRSRLFEPFFTTKEREKGSGLGLATVHGIVHQSGGGIEVVSEPGRGSTFTVLLPETSAAPREPEPIEDRPREAARPAFESVDGGGEVILLVEDEDNIREPAAEVLAARGYDVLAARDAREALELAERHPGPIQLLVTDIVMPGMSGEQLSAELSALRPETKMLYISGYPEDAIAQKGVLVAGQSFLQKPFPPSVLLDTVRRILDGGAAPDGRSSSPG